MRPLLPFALALLVATPVTALKIDIAHADIERALTIARSTEADRTRFHAGYIQPVNTPFVERAEVVSELRRVVLLAEDQIARGDRYFAYSSMRATDALQVFRKRVSVIARVRFHPQNNYVVVPAVTIALIGNEGALVGVRRDAVYGSAAGPGEFTPILGAVIEGSFQAEALGQGRREFRISLEGRELGRATFEFAAIE